MHRAPDADGLARLNTEFGDILSSGHIETTTASPAEIADHDVPDLARLKLRFDRHSYSRLRALIDQLNQIPA
jgi:hypothetical protein